MMIDTQKETIKSLLNVDLTTVSNDRLIELCLLHRSVPDALSSFPALLKTEIERRFDDTTIRGDDTTFAVLQNFLNQFESAIPYFHKKLLEMAATINRDIWFTDNEALFKSAIENDEVAKWLPTQVDVLEKILKNRLGLAWIAQSTPTSTAILTNENATAIWKNTPNLWQTWAQHQQGMDIVAKSRDLVQYITDTPEALAAVVNQDTAMRSLVKTQAASETLAASETAMNAICTNDNAVAALNESATAMTAIMANTAAHNAIAQHPTVLKTLASHSDLIQAILGTPDLLTKIITREAMSQLKDSTTVIAELAKSEAAITAIADNQEVRQLLLKDYPTAAELFASEHEEPLVKILVKETNVTAVKHARTFTELMENADMVNAILNQEKLHRAISSSVLGLRAIATNAIALSAVLKNWRTKKIWSEKILLLQHVKHELYTTLSDYSNRVIFRESHRFDTLVAATDYIKANVSGQPYTTVIFAGLTMYSEEDYAALKDEHDKEIAKPTKTTGNRNSGPVQSEFALEDAVIVPYANIPYRFSSNMPGRENNLYVNIYSFYPK